MKIIYFTLEKILMARKARDKELLRQIGNYSLVRNTSDRTGTKE